MCDCSLSRVQLSVTLRTEATRLLSPWGSPGKNAGVGCHFLLQGIFLTQGSNLHFLCLLNCQVDTLLLCYLGMFPNVSSIIFGWQDPELFLFISSYILFYYLFFSKNVL